MQNTFKILICKCDISIDYFPVVMIRPGSEFNISWIIDGHPIVDPSVFAKDATRYLGILLDMLQSASNFLGSLTIAVINR